MYHDLPRSASFRSFLLAVDEDLAEETRKKGCPCGGRLRFANYPGTDLGFGSVFDRLASSARGSCSRRVE